MALARPTPAEADLYNLATDARLAYILDAIRQQNGDLPVDGAGNVHYISTGTSADQHTLVASACNITGYDFGNTASYWCYVKFYDKANPTEADTPVRIVALPPGGGVARSVKAPKFLTVMAIRITKGAADNDTTAVVAGDVVASIDYTV
jgi:hypothetical protein